MFPPLSLSYRFPSLPVLNPFLPFSSLPLITARRPGRARCNSQPKICKSVKVLPTCNILMTFSGILQEGNISVFIALQRDILEPHVISNYLFSSILCTTDTTFTLHHIICKCSAVAGMGDRLATIGMGRKLGVCPF